jgi:hypothetical protein
VRKEGIVVEGVRERRWIVQSGIWVVKVLLNKSANITITS